MLKNTMEMDMTIEKTEKLETTPYRVKIPKREDVVIFGNTGLSFEVVQSEAKYLWHLHFTPEDSVELIQDKKAKHATMLVSGMYSLYKLSQDKSALESLNIDPTMNVELDIDTNDTLASALEELFIVKGHPEIVSRNSTHNGSNKLTLNLDKFKNLPVEDTLIVYLDKLSSRAQSATVDVVFD